MTPPIQNYLGQIFATKRGLKISSIQFFPVGGGSINNTYQVRVNSNSKFFLKLNSISKFPALFEKEKTGLEFIDKYKIIATPPIVACDNVDDQQLLLLEWIEGGLKTEGFWKEFGKQLAALHTQTWSPTQDKTLFGFEEDNYMGALPQVNEEKSNWIDFFINCRLQPQLKLATDKHFLQPKHIIAFENLYSGLNSLFDVERSSLLHGDLWSGNFMCNENAQPVLIDPAVYFGHRNMDLAMTTLFGGFDRAFYESYHYHYPLASNYREQWDICNLYPLLIHLNLFGSGYLGQIEVTLQKFN